MRNFIFLTSEAQRNFRNDLFRAIEAQRDFAMFQNKKLMRTQLPLLRRLRFAHLCKLKCFAFRFLDGVLQQCIVLITPAILP